VLTKSQLMSWRQCPKRLWLETHGDPAPPTDSSKLQRGETVGRMARVVFGDGDAVTIDRRSAGRRSALDQTATEMASLGRTLFEAAFGDDDLAAYADVVRPAADGWELLEVKDAGSVKTHHLDDVAIQAAAAQRSGFAPKRICITHVDTDWTYPGGDDYRGLFAIAEVTDDVGALVASVGDWVAEAKATIALPTAPARPTGPHCDTPYPCAFYEACAAQDPTATHPIQWLPGALSKAAKELVEAGAREMEDLPDEVLNETQSRVKAQTLAGVARFDEAEAAADVADWTAPLHFLDFETANPVVPLWAGTRPYAQIPFQFSLHLLEADGTLAHTECLLTDGNDPSRRFAEALIAACRSEGAVVVYNAGFERGRIKDLAQRYEALAPQLEAIAARLVDLQPVAKARYYHPDQRGSWSIKKVLPCLVPELRYDLLDGVKEGGMAIEAYLKLIHPNCSPERKATLEAQLRRYCHLDTLAMVALWARFAANRAVLSAALNAAPRP